MPAPDGTYYNLKRLHVVFALSAAALLGATVWMLAADHWRPWKEYQRTYRDQIEPGLTETRLRQERSAEFIARQTKFEMQLVKAEEAVPARELIDRFRQALPADTQADQLLAIDGAYGVLKSRPSASARAALVAELNRAIEPARFYRDEAHRRLRSARSRLDEARSALEAAIGQGRPEEQLAGLRGEVQRLDTEAGRLADAADEARRRHDGLAGILAEITREQQQARKALAECQESIDGLSRSLASQQPGVGKRLTRLPILDAFGRTLSVEQIWLPELTIDYDFQQVARFDRCTTCHLAIDKAQPDDPASPAIPREQVLTIRVTPGRKADEGDAGQRHLRGSPLQGLVLASRGLLHPEAATVGLVLPGTPAAEAGLRPGDVIEQIAGVCAPTRDEASALLIRPDAAAAASRPIELVIRRGLPHPFASHPRLDLFVGPNSPHPMAQFGCTICHDGQGSATDFTFASHTPDSPADEARWRKEYGWSRSPDWDYPMRPLRLTEASCLKCHHDVMELNAGPRFPDPPAPKLLAGYELVRRLGCFGCHEIRGVAASGKRIGPDLRPAADHSGPVEKVGPTLRGVAGKLDAAFLRWFTARPSGFHPQSRMPQLFGLHEHLAGRTLGDTRRLEAVELAGIAEYLLAASPAVAPADPPPGATGPPSAERGRALLEVRGCLACHKHKELPAGMSTAGPDLSNLGVKLRTPAGKSWLVSWLRDPARHSPRTRMPHPLLEPEPSADASQRTDPAADLAAYLLSSSTGTAVDAPPQVAEADVDELALMHLSQAFSRSTAAEYLRSGVPAEAASRTRADAAELAGKPTLAAKLRYVGRKTIAKRGCFGCHDVPGFENAAPIGPALSDWGRKQESLLAFEQVHRFLAENKPAANPRTAIFEQAVADHRREGFLWQKLRDPRSFDYAKADHKPFDAQLLMGRFTLSEAEREAVMTFVLGLVAQPPSARYVYQPDARRKALVEGRKVLEKYDCAVCHTLAMERWTFQFDPKTFRGPGEPADFDFLAPSISKPQVEASLKTGPRGKGRAEVVGMPRVDAAGKPVVAEGDEEDAQGEPLPMHAFTLGEPAVVNGEVWRVGGPDLLVYHRDLVQRRPAWGGQFARLLFPVALARAKADGATSSEQEAWGWVPPALVHEGAKVRPEWLSEYLLSPYAIRPAAVLRMPRFNLTPGEAVKLAEYFAASSGPEFPAAPTLGQTAAWENDGLAPPEHLARAMRLMTDGKTYCAKCHRIGDYSPGGQTRTVLAPDLERVACRLRPEYVRRWLANPKSVLPYTAMPVNFPPTGPALGQDLYPGTSVQQLDGVAELLLHYDAYRKRQTSVRRLVEQSERPAAGEQ